MGEGWIPKCFWFNHLVDGAAHRLEAARSTGVKDRGGPFRMGKILGVSF